MTKFNFYNGHVPGHKTYSLSCFSKQLSTQWLVVNIPFFSACQETPAIPEAWVWQPSAWPSYSGSWECPTLGDICSHFLTCSDGQWSGAQHLPHLLWFDFKGATSPYKKQVLKSLDKSWHGLLLQSVSVVCLENSRLEDFLNNLRQSNARSALVTTSYTVHHL